MLRAEPPSGQRIEYTEGCAAVAEGCAAVAEGCDIASLAEWVGKMAKRVIIR